MSEANPTKRGYRRHDFAKWFRRKSFVLYRGKDYGTRSDVMSQVLRQRACRPEWRIKLHISVKENPDRIEVDVLGSLDEEEK